MRIKSGSRGISPTLIKRLNNAGRSLLVLGDRLKIEELGQKILHTEYYYPSDDVNNVENLYIYGQSGSGKTWAMKNIAGQSFFKERRSWVIIDNKGSYRGNHLPNTKYAAQLKHYKLKPQGIPKSLMRVVVPEYYLNGLTDEEIKMDQITHSYRIPVGMASIPILFEITKLQEKSQYGAMYNIAYKQMLARTMNKPTINDMYNMLSGIVESTSNQGIRRWYENMVDRIRAAEQLTICEERWSPIGEGLLNAAYDGRPRWIVLTFKHAEASNDSINLAIYSAVLEEIRRVTQIAKDRRLNLRVGLMVDELRWYVEDSSSLSFSRTNEAIYRWGRSNRLFRIWGTQRNEQLHQLLRDSIDNYHREGAYQKVLYYFRMKDPGYCSYMDRQRSNSFQANLPYIVPYIKSSPPMFQVNE